MRRARGRGDIRTRERHLLRVARALPLILLVAGCGVQETAVIGAGAPATVDAAVGGQEADPLVFFRFPDGRLAPVPRFNGADVPASPDIAAERALRWLLIGPGRTEKAAGIGTSLPQVKDVNGVAVDLESPRHARVSLPIPVGGLGKTALSQLSCTAAYAMEETTQFTLRFSGQDGRTTTSSCTADAEAPSSGRSRTDSPGNSTRTP